MNLMAGVVILDEAIRRAEWLILYIHTASFVRINIFFLTFFFSPSNFTTVH